MIVLAGLWSHVIAAALFGALTLWTARRSLNDRDGRILVLACLATTAWALVAAASGPLSVAAHLFELVRNGAWLGFLHILWRQGNGRGRTATVGIIYVALYTMLALQFLIDLLPMLLEENTGLQVVAAQTSALLRMTAMTAGLVLIQNLYTAATVEARSAIRLPLAGLAALWFFDLNLYTAAYLARDWAVELTQLRGLAVIAVAPAFAFGAMRTQSWTVQLSRTMTFQSLGLVALCLYLMLMVGLTSALNLIGGDLVRVVQVVFVFLASLGAIFLLPSRSFRSWFRVKLAKHLFSHRYDYRAEWLRFTATLGRPGEMGVSLGQRVVQAIGDMVESPGGLLLVPDESSGLLEQGRWNWLGESPARCSFSLEAAAWFASNGHIAELDRLRAEDGKEEQAARHIPQRIISESRAWVLVPLVHFNRLAGLVVLEHPTVNRALDWEDFDLLKVAGQQVASYLAEAQGQEALAEVQRFDEFNRRFAFIMHDIKNLVSQLSLVTRNAERHADNPEFREDMLATLRFSTGRMNDLLARLSQHHKGNSDDPRAVSVGALCEAVAAAKRSIHPVVVGGEVALVAQADGQRLEQALTHLVQNAIDASAASDPVSIMISGSAKSVEIIISDAGIGMTPAFVRDQLFKPFVSTKEAGFGVGAFEARALISAMGGRIEVESRPDRGTSFTVILPTALRNDPVAEPAALAA